jgi:ERF superfamily protein
MEFQISSAEIGKITEALSKAQGKIENALKDSNNPFFKSKYADLSSVMAVTKEPLSSNNLCFSSSIVQAGGVNFLVCTLSHISGEWFRSYMPLMMAKQDMQSLGAAISYGRRFCLAALCHVGVEENDGEGTVDRGTGEVKKPEEVKKAVEAPIPFIALSEQQKEQIRCLVQAIDDEAFLKSTRDRAGVTDLTNVSLTSFKGLVAHLEKKIGA